MGIASSTHHARGIPCTRCRVEAANKLRPSTSSETCVHLGRASTLLLCAGRSFHGLLPRGPLVPIALVPCVRASPPVCGSRAGRLRQAPHLRWSLAWRDQLPGVHAQGHAPRAERLDTPLAGDRCTLVHAAPRSQPPPSAVDSPPLVSWTPTRVVGSWTLLCADACACMCMRVHACACVCVPMCTWICVECAWTGVCGEGCSKGACIVVVLTPSPRL